MTNKGQKRCGAILDYTYDSAIRCKLEPGHDGIHKTLGWEPLVGSTKLIVEMLRKRLEQERRTS